MVRGRASGRLLACLCLCALLVSCTPRAEGAWGGSVLPHGTRPVIKIGLVAPFEGRYRSLGYEVLPAVKRAIGQRNEAGGVAGYMVELAALDDGDDPASSALQARKLAVDPDVMGVVGPFSEAAALAAATVYGVSGLTAVTPANCSPALAEVSDGEMFCLGASADDLAAAMIERLPRGARVALLRAPESPERRSAASLAERLSWLAAQRWEGVWDDVAVSEWRAHPADLYLYDGGALAAAELLVEMRGGGVDAPLWGGPTLARTQLPQIAGGAVSGVCYAVPAPLGGDPAADEAFGQGYRGLASVASGPWAALAYDATSLLLDALERTIEARGHPSRPGVRRQMAEAQMADGTPLFERGVRRRAEIDFYCYAAQEGYPGRLSR